MTAFLSETELDRWRVDRDTADYGITAMETESDLNWQTRELLESICASVENVSEEFTLDAQDIPAL